MSTWAESYKLNLRMRSSGMSLDETAGFLGTSIPVLRSALAGDLDRGEIEQFSEDLGDLVSRLRQTADDVHDLIADVAATHGEPEGFEIAVPETDAEAKKTGFPTKSCFDAVVRMLMEDDLGILSPVFVPRSSASGTGLDLQFRDDTIPPRRP